jgi:hypothetical protein
MFSEFPAPFDGLSVYHALGSEGGWQVRSHCAVLRSRQSHVRPVKTTELSRARNGIHEEAERDGDGVKDGRLALPVFCNQDGQLIVKVEIAAFETSEVLKMETIQTKGRGRVHTVSHRSSSVLMSKLMDATPHAGSRSKGLRI